MIVYGIGNEKKQELADDICILLLPPPLLELAALELWDHDVDRSV
jgi:hypothetical protein